MTWQDPGGNPAPGGPEDDATRADWDLARLDSLVGDGGVTPAAGSDASPPPSAGPTPHPTPPGGPPPAPGYGPAPTPGYAPSFAPGMAPGYAPGMAWEPPTSYGAPSGPGGGLEFAGALVRLVAWLIDVIILGIVGIGINLVLSVAVLGAVDWSSTIGGFGPGSPMPDGGAIGAFLAVTLLVAGLSAVIDLVYFVLLWSSGARATLGMRVFGLQIGNAADGRTLVRAQAVRRWLAMGTWLSVLGAIPLVGGLIGLAQLGWYLVLLITTASNDRRMGLHDQFAGTAVVQRAGESRTGLAIGCLVLIVALLVVVPIIAIVSLLALGSQVETILSTVGESI